MATRGRISGSGHRVAIIPEFASDFLCGVKFIMGIGESGHKVAAIVGFGE